MSPAQRERRLQFATVCVAARLYLHKLSDKSPVAAIQIIGNSQALAVKTETRLTLTVGLFAKQEPREKRRLLNFVLSLDVTAKRRSAAGLDRRHHLQLAEADVAGVGSAPRRAMSAKDVGGPRAVTGGPPHAATVRRAAVASPGSRRAGPRGW